MYISTQENIRFIVMNRSPENFGFPFSLLRRYQTPEFYLKTAVFELVQQLYHATEIGNVTNAVSACADQP